MFLRLHRWSRGRLDITGGDLIFAALAPWLPWRAKRAVWPTQMPHLAAWSVRTAWDAFLGVQNWTRGDEIIVSEANIPDMIRLIEVRGLVAVPVRLDPQTLSVAARDIENLITPRTRAILVAHLFGSRMPLHEIAEVAQRRGLLLVEDCAQSYLGTHDWGHDGADLSLFSFGLIKTQTALGGAVIFGRDPLLLQKIERSLALHPRVSLTQFYRRWLQALALKMACPPWIFGFLWLGLQFAKRDPDEWISSLSRGFAREDFLSQIRRRHHRATLILLRHRLHNDRGHRVARRRRCGLQAASVLKTSVLGFGAASATFWAFPVRVSNREECRRRLQNAGFDASIGVSSVVSCSTSPTPMRAALDETIFLPIYPEMPPSERRRLLDLVQRD